MTVINSAVTTEQVCYVENVLEICSLALGTNRCLQCSDDYLWLLVVFTLLVWR